MRSDVETVRNVVLSASVAVDFARKDLPVSYRRMLCHGERSPVKN